VLKKRKKPVQEKPEAATRGKYSSLTNEAAESVLTGKQRRVAATGDLVTGEENCKRREARRVRQ
jgi:hypothetical protein